MKNPRKLPASKQRRERLVTLVTSDELNRIDKMRASMFIPHRSELVRNAVMGQVERWEAEQQA